jgi:hypothetical protein
MAKYEVSWTRELWLRVTIEADSLEQAEQKFWDGEFENEQQYGSEIQQDVDFDLKEEN